MVPEVTENRVPKLWEYALAPGKRKNEMARLKTHFLRTSHITLLPLKSRSCPYCKSTHLQEIKELPKLSSFSSSSNAHKTKVLPLVAWISKQLEYHSPIAGLMPSGAHLAPGVQRWISRAEEPFLLFAWLFSTSLLTDLGLIRYIIRLWVSMLRNLPNGS